MSDYYNKFRKELAKDIFILILYAICSVGIVCGIIKMIS